MTTAPLDGPDRSEAEIATEESAPAPRVRRAYLPAAERRRRIIEAAQEVFARSNLQGARTRDIARTAEINQATLFEHFESKEALFHEAVVEPMLEAMRGMHTRARNYEAAESLDEMQNLAEVSTLRQIETMTEIFPLFTAALFSDLELGRRLYREQIAPLLKARVEAIRPLVKDELDPELVDLALFGIMFALAMDRTFAGTDQDTRDLARQITRLAVTGFARPHN